MLYQSSQLSPIICTLNRNTVYIHQTIYNQVDSQLKYIHVHVCKNSFAGYNSHIVILLHKRCMISDPPRIPSSTANSTEVILGNRVVLPCPALGTPTPRITWYKDGKVVTGNELGVKLLTGEVTSNEKRVSGEVTNKIGVTGEVTSNEIEVTSNEIGVIGEVAHKISITGEVTHKDIRVTLLTGLCAVGC